jgi:hypothetical protein
MAFVSPCTMREQARSALLDYMLGRSVRAVSRAERGRRIFGCANWRAGSGLVAKECSRERLGHRGAWRFRRV